MAAAAVVPVQGGGGESLWEAVMELTRAAQDKNIDPMVWAVQLSSILNSARVVLPSPDLAHLLVSHICWANHLPITWKFLDKALSLKLVPPMLLLSLLSCRSLLSFASFLPFLLFL